ncbi:MAG: nuclear transport factor 2 family protein [Chitinophagaceae bacterium]|nr:nuclear transport factor 2 family protein [Chitinophagaceae bacterium]
MLHNRSFILVSCFTMLIIASCNTKKENALSGTGVYKPDSQELYDTIVKHDSLFFTAYNNCDLALQANYYDDSIEFYHDKGGLMTSKQQLLEGTKNNICGKVTRELVKGSIEVYPIKDYGAIEMGLHIFHNKQEPDAIPHASKFIIFWQHKNNEWKMKRVVSLH